MAHAIIEWTDNLEADGFQIQPLLELIAAAMRDSDGVFPWGGIRVRGVRVTDYVIADNSGADAFINVTIKMAAGRPVEFKRQFFESLFDSVKRHTATIFEQRYLAISMYVEETDESGSYKKNNIHERFRGTK